MVPDVFNISAPSFPYTAPFLVAADPSYHLKTTFQQANYYFLSDIASCDLVLSALGELSANYTTAYRSSTDYSLPVKQIRSQILSNYTDADFALDVFIKSLPFHYDYLRKLFKKELGITPLEYMTPIRMKRACVLLTIQESVDHSIAEIT